MPGTQAGELGDVLKLEIGRPSTSVNQVRPEARRFGRAAGDDTANAWRHDKVADGVAQGGKDDDRRDKIRDRAG